MRANCSILLLVAAALVGCTTPYRDPVTVHGGSPFPGIAGLVENAGAAQVDVLMVHGMCTHTSADANASIDALVAALDGNLVADAEPPRALALGEGGGIETVVRTVRVGAARLRFTAIIWSPLTRGLKSQLAYDITGQATNCTEPGDCRPQRALLNGQLKDGLLNDCLADAIIYQGDSRRLIRQRMIDAITRTVDAAQSQARAEGLATGPFAIVTDSLGSKITFDALDEMTSSPELPAPPGPKAAGATVIGRLAVIYMRANQMPLLSLADQVIDSGPSAAKSLQPAGDSLQRLLMRKAEQPALSSAAQAGKPHRMTLVAFTDPNDLLSYRLLSTRYALPGIAVADVLVSNAPTWFGAVEMPTTAHTGYARNAGVARLVVCGSAGSVLCRDRPTR